MKFAAAILLFAQFANADGHDDAMTAANATTSATMGLGGSMGEMGMQMDPELEAHISSDHQRVKKAFEMVNMFCDHHEHDEHGQDGHQTTDEDDPETDPETAAAATAMTDLEIETIKAQIAALTATLPRLSPDEKV